MAITIDERSFQKFAFNRIRYSIDDRDLTPAMKIVIELTREGHTPCSIAGITKMPLVTVYDQISKAKSLGWNL